MVQAASAARQHANTTPTETALAASSQCAVRYFWLVAQEVAEGPSSNGSSGPDGGSERRSIASEPSPYHPEPGSILHILYTHKTVVLYVDSLVVEVVVDAFSELSMTIVN